MKRRVLALIIVLAVVLTAVALASGTLVNAVTADGPDGKRGSIGPLVDSVAGLFVKQTRSQSEIDNKRSELQAELAATELKTWTRVENQLQLKAGELDDRVMVEVALFAEQLEKELEGLQESLGKDYIKQILNSQLKSMLGAAADDAGDRRQKLYEDILKLQSDSDEKVEEKRAELAEKIVEFRIEREQIAKTELEEYTSKVVAEAEQLLAAELSRMEETLQAFIDGETINGES